MKNFIFYFLKILFGAFFLQGKRLESNEKQAAIREDVVSFINF